MKRAVFLAAVWSVGLSASCAETGVTLVDGGVARAVIVRSASAGAPGALAADELKGGIERLTGAALPVADATSNGLASVRLALSGSDDGILPNRVRKLAEKIRHDGFVLCADSGALYVVARERRGLFYGVYEVLKRYGGMRWILPGPEGEFFMPRKSFVVPEVEVVDSPAFRNRRLNLVSAWGSKETPLWMIRNGMSHSDPRYGSLRHLGGHVFSTLLPDTHFHEHPEYYGLYKGKRLPQCGDPAKITKTGTGGMANQPCTSNPETVRIMCENLVKMLEANPDTESFCILNNDSTAWCECENCVRLDPPEEAKRGLRSTRFWLLANALVAAGKAVAPQVRFLTSAYQTFQEPPTGVAPDPRAEVDFCVHHRCYLHGIGDRRCEINERYRKILAGWRRGDRNVLTYEYTDILPRGEVWYLPLARLLRDDLRYYRSIGNVGWCDEVAPYDGHFVTKDRTATERWVGNALDIYLTAQALWNPDFDLDAAEDEAGALYYGKAWPAIRRYRRRLAAIYASINDHFCYGSRLWQLGRGLEAPGLSGDLRAQLDAAEGLAKGDARVETILKREREFFELIYVKASEEFGASHRESAVRAGVLDGDPKSDRHMWDFCDRAFVGEKVSLMFLYGPNRLLCRYIPQDRPSTRGAKLEFVTRDGVKGTVLDGPGEIALPLKRAVEGESIDLGVRLVRGKDVIGWNGPATEGPGLFRKVFFKKAIVRNGDFADIEEKDGVPSPRSFSVKGPACVVTDGTASVGTNFLRICKGNAYLLQSIQGLSGVVQTYGIPKVFNGVLRIRMDVRGKGHVSCRLSESKLRTVAEMKERWTFDSHGKWTEFSVDLDCSSNGDSWTYAYVFLYGEPADFDNLRMEIVKGSWK